MKTAPKKLNIMFFIIIIMFTGIACSKNNNTLVPSNDGIDVQTNSSKFNSLLSARTTYKGQPFEIKNINRDGDLLKIEVLGGCEPDMYRVVWDGVVLESNPAQVRLVVSYEPTLQINCLVPVNPTLTVDLKKLIGSNYTPNGYTFTVSNASKEEDKIIDPSGTVTTKK
jgi:hypothetical protein